MPSYMVTEERKFLFYQEVEADSKEQAIEVANEIGDWIQDDNYAEVEHFAGLKEE